MVGGVRCCCPPTVGSWKNWQQPTRQGFKKSKTATTSTGFPSLSATVNVCEASNFVIVAVLFGFVFPQWGQHFLHSGHT